MLNPPNTPPPSWLPTKVTAPPPPVGKASDVILAILGVGYLMALEYVIESPVDPEVDLEINFKSSVPKPAGTEQKYDVV